MDLEKALEWIAQIPAMRSEIEQLRRQNELITLQLQSFGAKSCFSVSDICRMLDITKPTARSKPYLLPNYGLSDFPGRRRKWKLETVLTWIRQTPRQHERAWLMLPAKDQRAFSIRGSLRKREEIDESIDADHSRSSDRGA